MTPGWEKPSFANDRYFLIGVQEPAMSLQEADRSFAELQELVRSAGGSVAHTVTVRLRQIDARTFLGRGRVEELGIQARASDVSGVIFDADFSPVQQRNLEDAFQLRVIGRTELILDIFARRARTHEGKLQVELAQLQYLRPRLVGQGFVLSRLGGGIGTRGPGESKLEMDRRRIADRIGHLRRELSHVRRSRQTQRKKRHKQEVPTLALVGYTNAGKSTLLRALTGADVLVEDRLFATLDPAARRLLLPDGRVAVLTDTVGFIHRLPTSLVEAFKATLEEVVQADLLLHVIDASSQNLQQEINTTEQVLEEIGAADRRRLRVFNKIDQAMNHSVYDTLSSQTRDESVAVSGLYGIGLHDLLASIVKLLHEHQQTLSLRLPYDRYDLLSRLYAIADVNSIEYHENAIHITAAVDERIASELLPFTTPESPEIRRSSAISRPRSVPRRYGTSK